MTTLQTTAVTRQQSRTDVITLDRDGFREQWISARRSGPEELSVLDEFPDEPEHVVAQVLSFR